MKATLQLRESELRERDERASDSRSTLQREKDAVREAEIKNQMLRDEISDLQAKLRVAKDRVDSASGDAERQVKELTARHEVCAKVSVVDLAVESQAGKEEIRALQATVRQHKDQLEQAQRDNIALTSAVEVRPHSLIMRPLIEVQFPFRVCGPS